MHTSLDFQSSEVFFNFNNSEERQSIFPYNILKMVNHLQQSLCNLKKCYGVVDYLIYDLRCYSSNAQSHPLGAEPYVMEC